MLIAVISDTAFCRKHIPDTLFKQPHSDLNFFIIFYEEQYINNGLLASNKNLRFVSIIS